MSSINQVVLVGRLGRDAEVKTTNAGQTIANLSVATSEKWKDGTEKTAWHRVVIFNEKLADIAGRFCKKGDQVGITGKIDYRKYTDQNGLEKLSTEIVVDRFNGSLTLLGGGNRDGNGAGERQDAPQRPALRQVTNIATELSDDIPF